MKIEDIDLFECHDAYTIMSVLSLEAAGFAAEGKGYQLGLDGEIRTDGKHAVVRGKEQLSGAPVQATDIRAGAGLVIAALCAQGYTEVSQVHHIDRGYPNFVDDLRRLGAHVDRPHSP